MVQGQDLVLHQQFSLSQLGIFEFRLLQFVRDRIRRFSGSNLFVTTAMGEAASVDFAPVVIHWKNDRRDGR
jgi:hypothetical protein